MDTTSEIAAQAQTLSTELKALADNCGHESIAKDVSSIAWEIHILGTNLCLLHGAMSTDGPAYTIAFRQDLDEITNELQMIFDEVEECSTQLQKADPSSYNAVSWFFRKGRAMIFQKHLKALKTTVVVMSTVLNHGRGYGTQVSPDRLAESTPHTMSENRAILESVLAKNRSALGDLHGAEQSLTHRHSPSTSSDTAPEFAPGAHGRNLSFATGVDSIAVPDVLPSSDEPKKDPISANDGLARRFSKRVALSVHKSIMDIKANDAEATLQKRWIKAEINRPMPRIAESSSATTSNSLTGDEMDGIAGPHSSDSTMSRSRNSGRTLPGSSVGKSLGRALRGLALGNKHNTQGKGSEGDGLVDVNSNGEQKQLAKMGEERGPVARMKQKLSKPSLRISDYNEDFENGV